MRMSQKCLSKINFKRKIVSFNADDCKEHSDVFLNILTVKQTNQSYKIQNILYHIQTAGPH